jgi:hypothetical protein
MRSPTNRNKRSPAIGDMMSGPMGFEVGQKFTSAETNAMLESSRGPLSQTHVDNSFKVSVSNGGKGGRI